MTELYEFAGWLFENPDSDLLEFLVVPDSGADVNLGGLLREFEANGWHELPGGGSVIRDVALQSHEGGRALVLVVDDFDGSKAVDRQGNVVRVDDSRMVSAFLWTVELSDDNRWRLADAEPLGPVNGIED